MELFYIFIVNLVIQVFTFVKIYYTVYFNGFISFYVNVNQIDFENILDMLRNIKSQLRPRRKAYSNQRHVFQIMRLGKKHSKTVVNIFKGLKGKYNWD